MCLLILVAFLILIMLAWFAIEALAILSVFGYLLIGIVAILVIWLLYELITKGALDIKHLPKSVQNIHVRYEKFKALPKRAKFNLIVLSLIVIFVLFVLIACLF